MTMGEVSGRIKSFTNIFTTIVCSPWVHQNITVMEQRAKFVQSHQKLTYCSSAFVEVAPVATLQLQIRFENVILQTL